MNKKYLQNFYDNKSNSILVDVRNDDEYGFEHLKDSINIPLDEIDNYNFDKTKTIYLYCKSGKRSQVASMILNKKGFNVIDLGAFEQLK